MAGLAVLASLLRRGATMNKPRLRPDDQPLPRGLAARVEAMAAAGEVGDAALVRAAAEGDQDAFAALVARYQKRAFWAAFHVVGRVEDARDVVQEAFVRLHRSLHSYDPARSFYTWFYRIVMNLAIDQLRRQKGAKASSLDELPQLPPDEREQGEAEGTALLHERHDLVWQVLETLDAKFKAVLVLRDLEGLSCREIAPILRITHATARWRVHRARMLFKERWERMDRRQP
jgi:RNA polymerase sigma-70 factor (ECF subfamily)